MLYLLTTRWCIDISTVYMGLYIVLLAGYLLYLLAISWHIAYSIYTIYTCDCVRPPWVPRKHLIHTCFI
jgi:hypothetical protein